MNILSFNHKENHIRAVVSYIYKDEAVKLRLGIGNYLIGTSQFATVRLNDSNDSICGALVIDAAEIKIKCLASYPGMYIDGKVIKQDEVVQVSDMLEIQIHNKLVKIETIIDKKNMLDSCLFENNIDVIKRDIYTKLMDELTKKEISILSDDDVVNFERIRLILKKIVIDTKSKNPEFVEYDLIEKEIFTETTGLGPLESLLSDSSITEIMINKKDQIFVERQGTLSRVSVSFSSEKSLLNTIERIVAKVGRRIDQSSPIVDARLIDGSRINAVLPCIALKGPCLTIRRFSKTPISIQNLIDWGSINEDIGNFLKVLVLEKKNIIVSGGTGSGKTTLLNCLSSFIPEEERIITIEDSAELQLQQDHVVSLEARPPNLENKGAISIRDLVKNTLRMRPDRIIVGECRGGEALDMLQAMNTGHDGSMTTAHANSAEDMLRRLETMVMMAGMKLPLQAIREQIASALTVIIQQSRTRTGRRMVTDISWVRGHNRSTMEYDVLPIFYRGKSEELYLDETVLLNFINYENISKAIQYTNTEIKAYDY